MIKEAQEIVRNRSMYLPSTILVDGDRYRFALFLNKDEDSCEKDLMLIYYNINPEAHSSREFLTIGVQAAMAWAKYPLSDEYVIRSNKLFERIDELTKSMQPSSHVFRTFMKLQARLAQAIGAAMPVEDKFDELELMEKGLEKLLSDRYGNWFRLQISERGFRFFETMEELKKWVFDYNHIVHGHCVVTIPVIGEAFMVERTPIAIADIERKAIMLIQLKDEEQ